MNAPQKKLLPNGAGRRYLMTAATLAMAAFAAPAQAQGGDKGMTAVQLLKHSLDTFLAKDMEGWANPCTRRRR
jgi:hypothetical protein